MTNDVVSLDSQSLRLIELLQINGRTSFTELGKKVGMSEAATRQRVQKLIASGVISITAKVDETKLGITREALIAISGGGDIAVIAKKLRSISAVRSIAVTAGGFDLLVEVHCRDDQELVEVINTQIRAIAEVSTTQTFLYLKRIEIDQ